jgi:hypothetical protein
MWFDYVHLSEVERDQRFADAYLKAYRHFYARRNDAHKAKYVNPVHKKNKRAWNLIPKGRQAADECSMPYDYYCRFAIAISDESNWKHLAMLNQVYSVAMKALVLDRWHRYIENYVVIPDLPSQSPDYHSYIQSAAQQRPNPHQLVYDLLCKRHLNWAQASSLFSSEVMQKVRELEVMCGPTPAQ